MVEESNPTTSTSAAADVADEESADDLLSRATLLIPAAIASATAAKTLSAASRWSAIITKLSQLPASLSALSSHPLFSKSPLVLSLLRSLHSLLSSLRHSAEHPAGKLHLQSSLNSHSAHLDVLLRDAALLVKSGLLAASSPSAASHLLARLQIGPENSKQRAVDELLEFIAASTDNLHNLIAAVNRTDAAALVQLLAVPRIRDGAAMIISLILESGNCESLLVSEGVLPSLIRVVESGGSLGREKAVASLQRLSMSVENARLIASHDGVRLLVEVCQTDDSGIQLASLGALKNLSAVLELRQGLADEGVVRIMIGVLDSGVSLGLKEYAAECLQNLTSGSESLKRAVVSEGGIRTLLAYIDSPLPQESAVGALRNLVDLVSPDSLVSLGLLPRLAHVMKNGSVGARQAAAGAVCNFSSSLEMKRLVGESGCLPLLVNLLEAKVNNVREVAAQALASLMSCPYNRKELKKDERSVPNLVMLLDPSPQNTAKKYAVCCLLFLVCSKKCKRVMISYGAIGYLKKLTELDVSGGKKLLERLERGGLRSLFGNK